MSDYNDDPYKVLGISRDATERDIKTAYRKLALKHHPDRKIDPVERANAQHTFSKIANAYEILTDPDMKRDYESCTTGFSTTPSSSSSGSPATTTGKAKKFRPKFNDAYEVWKKDFRELFGREYPGAEYDWVDPNSEEAKRIAKNVRQLGMIENEETKTILAIEADHSLDTDSGRETKKKGWNPFRRNKNKKADAKQSDTGITSPATTTRPKKTTPTAIVKRDANSSALVATSNALVLSGDVNNRPFYMDVKERKEGPVTITELIMKRPDGSTERVTMKTGIPGPPPRKMLEGPKEERLAIEGGKPKKMIKGSKKNKAIMGKKDKSKNNGRSTALVVKA